VSYLWDIMLCLRKCNLRSLVKNILGVHCHLAGTSNKFLPSVRPVFLSFLNTFKWLSKRFDTIVKIISG
jgi:hypothetical protein